jgi:hypothetical protein
MALNLLEGFDSFTTTAYIATKHSWRTNNGVASIVGGKNGNALRLKNASVSGSQGAYEGVQDLTLTFASPISGGAGYVGFAFRRSTNNLPSGGTLWTLANFGGFGGSGFGLFINSSGQVNARTTVSLGTSTALAYNTWYYIEVYMKPSTGGPTGAATVWLNGVQFATLGGSAALTGTLSQTDLLAKTNSAGAPSSIISFDFDNIYVCDVSGSYNNSRLGPVQVTTLFPSSDNSVAWSRTGGSGTNYSCVNDADPDGDTSYVSSGTGGTIDRYGLTNLAITQTVIGLQTNLVAKVVGNVAPLWKISGTDYVGNTYATSASPYKYGSQTYDTNPGTSAAWTQSDINAAFFGLKRITGSGGSALRVTQATVDVGQHDPTWDPAPSANPAGALLLMLA